MVPQVWKIHC